MTPWGIYFRQLARGKVPLALRRRVPYIDLWLSVVIVALLLAVMLISELALGRSAEAAIPSAAQQHQRELTRIVQQEWGLSGSVALHAAQIHQESSWRPNARSPYAHGLAQFTPDTARWIAEIYPDLDAREAGGAGAGSDFGRGAPYSPGWAMRAMARYNRHIYDRLQPMEAETIAHCDRIAMMLSAYNGGPGWVSRDRRLAAAAGMDPDRWWDHTEHYTARADWARRENRHYPHRILFELEPRYLRAGWRGVATCP